MKTVRIKMNKHNVLIGRVVPYGPLYNFIHNATTSEANKKFASKHEIVGIIANEFRINYKDEKKFIFECNMQTDHYNGDSTWMEEDWLRVVVLR
jgi:hypothetical protein